MEPQGPTTSGPPPAHITSSLQYTQPGPPITSQGKPPSYVNPDQGSTQQGSSASFTQQTWMQGPGAEDIGIIIEPHPMTVVDNTTTEKKKDEGDVLSFSSDAPSVQHFNVSFVFDKTFREHKGANAVDCMQAKLNSLYTKTLKVTYNIFVCLFGFWLAFLWAVVNGVVSFVQSWCISPLLRVSLVLVKGVLPIILDPMSLILKALMDACRYPNIGGLIGGAMSAVTGK